MRWVRHTQVPTVEATRGALTPVTATSGSQSKSAAMRVWLGRACRKRVSHAVMHGTAAHAGWSKENAAPLRPACRLQTRPAHPPAAACLAAASTRWAATALHPWPRPAAAARRAPPTARARCCVTRRRRRRCCAPPLAPPARGGHGQGLRLAQQSTASAAAPGAPSTMQRTCRQRRMSGSPTGCVTSNKSPWPPCARCACLQGAAAVLRQQHPMHGDAQHRCLLHPKPRASQAHPPLRHILKRVPLRHQRLPPLGAAHVAPHPAGASPGHHWARRDWAISATSSAVRPPGPPFTDQVQRRAALNPRGGGPRPPTHLSVCPTHTPTCRAADCLGLRTSR